MHTGLKILNRSWVVAGLLAGSAVVAHAQTSPELGRQGHKDASPLAAKVEQHLADLKTQLQITTSQEGSWATFSAAVRPLAQRSTDQPNRAELDKLTTPQRIDALRAHHAQHAAERQANREKRENAVKAFYAELTASQKITFDAAHSKLMRRWDRPHHSENR